LQERKQFKTRIADFQATQFKLADMAGKIVSARLVLRQAAELMDQGHPAASAQCAIAKKIATDQGFEVCNDALQMLGGYGYLKVSAGCLVVGLECSVSSPCLYLQDYDVERYVRDCRVHQILEGTNEIMRHIVGKALVS
jgi:alkylation response protein AidB-like acyl-CoA dehydrogenase